MTPKPLRRPSSIAPEIAVVFTLAVLSLAPLLLSSGVESLDDVFYGRSYSLFTLEPLVGLDSFLHWTAAHGGGPQRRGEARAPSSAVPPAA